MGIAVASKLAITRWDAPTSFAHMWGGQHKDGFVATCIFEIEYEDRQTDSGRDDAQ